MPFTNISNNMTITGNTKIGTLIRQHPQALDVIVSLNPKFEKLRNPLLRKLMAGRTTIAMACGISGNKPEDFFLALKPLGFTVGDSEVNTNKSNEIPEKAGLPAYLQSIPAAHLMELDARPFLQSGGDPLPAIIEKVKAIKPGGLLKVINTFEPSPLIALLEKQGFESYTDRSNDQFVETYFHKKTDGQLKPDESATDQTGFPLLLERYAANLQKIDVRHLEMPAPMLAIFDALDNLPAGAALFVYHKRIPVFLLPELRDRGFDFRINEVAENDVQLLIFKDS
jgi:uncharacterized protein (DUF2249 family)